MLAAATLTLVFLVWACGTDGGDDGEAGTPATTEPAPTTSERDLPPAFVPVTGPEGEDGTPEPPPVHAVFSVVVRGDTSWDPYSGPELLSLDTEAAEADAARLRRLGQTLHDLDVPASIELAYGPAAALCTLDPGIFDELEAEGHRIGIHAQTRGELFRAHRALGACGIVPTTVSGLAAMADPSGPTPPSRESVVDAFAIMSVLDIHQVVGQLSPLCTELGLAAPAHGYGTGAFTAPWRSAWVDDRPCSDTPGGRIVAIDQTRLAPPEGATAVDTTSLDAIQYRTGQVLGYALDHRYVEEIDLPMPGFFTWGVSVRLADLVADPTADEEGEGADDEDDGAESGGAGSDGAGSDAGDEDTTDPGSGDATDPGNGEDTEGDATTTTTTTTAPDRGRRVAPLDEELLGALVELVTEHWHPAMESGRLRWMLADDVAAIFRPLEPPTDRPDRPG